MLPVAAQSPGLSCIRCATPAQARKDPTLPSLALPASPPRTIHFFASSDKAKRELGWAPKHNFQKDVEALVNDYKRQVGHAGRMSATLCARQHLHCSAPPARSLTRLV